MRPLYAVAIATVLIAGLLAGSMFFIQSRRLSDERGAAAGDVPVVGTLTVEAAQSSVEQPAAGVTTSTSFAPATVQAAAATPTHSAMVSATATVLAMAPTSSSFTERPASALRPREGVVLSIPILSVNGTEQPILPGTPTPTPSWWQRVEGPVPDALAKPVLDGYLRFWDRRARALSTLDSSGLTEVMDGPPLAAELAAMERLRAAGQVQRVDVNHSIVLLWASPEEAAVRDTLLNRSATVPQDESIDPGPTPTPETYAMAYRLVPINGVWKVTEAVRLAPSW